MRSRSRTAAAAGAASFASMRLGGRLLGAVTATVVAVSPALAQPGGAMEPPGAHIWEIPFGTHVTRLPADFVVGGCIPPEGETFRAPVRLDSFRDYARCPAGEDRLGIISLVQDDVAEFVARARRNANLIAENTADAIAGQPVAFAVLVDEAGRVLGYRIETVAAGEPGPAAAFLRMLFPDAWSCTARADSAGETCDQSTAGRRVTLDVWPIAAPDAPAVRLTVVQLDPAAAPALGTEAATELPDDRPRPPYANRLAAFMAGGSPDCPGCNLADIDLRRRDLSGGDLSGAILTGAILHGANLSDADLSGADLRGANLNRAIVAGTNFGGATLESAMLFAAEGEGANFTGAGLRSALIGDAVLPGARFDGASLDGVDLGGATLTGASFFFATLRYASLAAADLTGADLRGALASDAVLTGAILAQADATDAVMERVDFRGADFTGANLTRAGLAEALLQGARLDGATLTEARLAGAIMPDGAIAP